MAFRTWTRTLSAARGVGALAGAGQLGVAYGLDLVRPTRTFDVTERDQWAAQLTWIAWFAMVAAVTGAVVTGWLVTRSRPPAAALGVGMRSALAATAALGAAVVVPLTMQPARTAQLAGGDPVVAVGVCAGIGALVGAFAGFAALANAVSRWSFGVLIGALWAIALVSVVSALGTSGPLPLVRLGVFDAALLSLGTAQRAALFTMPALALLAGAGLGWMARRRGSALLTVALAGLPGPALLTLAYLVAGPGDGGPRYQAVPYWAAMTATGAGVLGSVLAAVIRRGDETPQTDGPQDGDETPPTDGPPPGDTGSPRREPPAGRVDGLANRFSPRPTTTGAAPPLTQQPVSHQPGPPPVSTPGETPRAPHQKDGEYVDWVTGLSGD